MLITKYPNRIKDLEQLLKETTKQIKDDNFAITTLKEQYQNKEIEKKLLNEKFEKVMNRLDSLEKEIIEKDYRNEILSKKLEQRIMSTAEDYKQKTLSMLVKQDSMRNSLSNSFRIQGENSASRLNRILINEHPEYLEFVILKYLILFLIWSILIVTFCCISFYMKVNCLKRQFKAHYL